MEVRPSFDPVAGVWFHGEVEAPTIRELLSKLPKGTKVADYYPIGKEPPVIDRGLVSGPSERVTLPGLYLGSWRQKVRGRKEAAIKKTRVRKGGRPRKEPAMVMIKGPSVAVAAAPVRPPKKEKKAKVPKRKKRAKKPLKFREPRKPILRDKKAAPKKQTPPQTVFPTSKYTRIVRRGNVHRVEALFRGWSDHEIDLVIARIKGGFSYGEVADELGGGKNRNHVAGIVHRIKKEKLL